MTEYTNQGLPCDQQGFLDETMRETIGDCPGGSWPTLEQLIAPIAGFSAVVLIIVALRRPTKSRSPRLAIVRPDPSVFDRVGEQDAD